MAHQDGADKGASGIARVGKRKWGYDPDQVDAFLDRAVISHVGTVTIIHGKGTGLLRKAIHKRLKQLKYVKSFRLGTFGEGEDGVTIVSLE